jgi:hypothetical protein
MSVKKITLLSVLVIVSGMAVYSQKPTDVLIKDSIRAINLDNVRMIEVEAKVDAAAWKRHLESRLQAVVDKAASKGLPAGLYTINVRFLIEKDGSISDVAAINDIGYGMKEAIEKIFRTAPKWTPGTQNGVAVRSYHTQPVSFSISK